MYAELSITLKSKITAEELSAALVDELGSSLVNAHSAVKSTRLFRYRQQIVAAFRFPDGTLVAFLHLTLSEIAVYIYGGSIAEIKERCERALTQLQHIERVLIANAQVKVIVPIDDLDISILGGEVATWRKAFWEALKEKVVRKLLVPSVIVALAVYYFLPSSPALVSAVIGFFSTTIGVIAEAAMVANTTAGLKWKATP